MAADDASISILDEVSKKRGIFGYHHLLHLSRLMGRIFTIMGPGKGRLYLYRITILGRSWSLFANASSSR